MKSVFHFLRMTLVGGLLFLVPIIVCVIILEKAGAVAYKLVDPLAAHLPFESVIGLRTPLFLAIGLLVLFCFVAGLFARTSFAKKIVRALERSVLSNLPGYEFIKGLGESFFGIQPQLAYETVMARIEDAWQFGFLVERLENGHIAVFIPDAPNPYSGSVYIMTLDRVKPIAIPAMAVMKCVKRLGAGSNELLRGVSLKAELPK